MQGWGLGGLCLINLSQDYINSPKIFVRFRFRIDINWTDDLSHSYPHRYFTPNSTLAFAFVILKVINSVIILFRFALMSVSMVVRRTPAPTANFQHIRSCGKENRASLLRISSLSNPEHRTLTH